MKVIVTVRVAPNEARSVAPHQLGWAFEAALENSGIRLLRSRSASAAWTCDGRSYVEFDAELPDGPMSLRAPSRT